MRPAGDVPFVDAHVHLWDLDRLRYPWLTPPFADDGPNGSVEPIARTFTLDDHRLAMGGRDVRGVVHVEAGAHPDEALAETRWLQEMADATGMPNAIVAFAALDDPDIDRLLEAQAAHPAVRGIRHIVNWHADPRRSYADRDVTGDPAWARGFAALARHGLSFDLQCYPGQFATVATVIERSPETPVILNHMGMPVDHDEWRREIGRLAGLPGMSVKLSGFGFVDRDWTVETIRPFAHMLIDLFGPSRVMLASDVPTDLLFAPAARILAALDALTESYGEDDRRAMWGGNADRVYRLGLGL